ncbi:MAG: hypothetical protein IPP04_22140 [Saprospiraceae bacterium]|nr:hypothetical protein [Saprospiraceae bacterium]
MKIEIIIEKTKTGYSAYAKKYAVYTVGKKLVKLKSNMVEALNLHFEDQGIVISESDLKNSRSSSLSFLNFIKLLMQSLIRKNRYQSKFISSIYCGLKKPSTKQSNRILKEVQNVAKNLPISNF